MLTPERVPRASSSVAILQTGLGAAGGDFIQLFDFAVRRSARDRLVTVFNGPHVVGADGARVVIALLLAFGHDVYRSVVHHRGGQPDFVGFFGIVVDIIERQIRTGFEVMPQAQGVAHLVHRGFFQALHDELFLFGLALGSVAGGCQ